MASHLFDNAPAEPMPTYCQISCLSELLFYISNVLIKKNAFENVVCVMVVILFEYHCVKLVDLNSNFFLVSVPYDTILDS